MKSIIIALLISIAAGANNYHQVLKVAKDYQKKYQAIDTKAEYRELEQAISRYSKRFNIPKSILFAICETESGYRYKIQHRAVYTSIFKNGKWRRGKVRAVGLGGIIFLSNPHVLKPLGIKPKDLYTIKGNVAAICAVLRYKMDKIQNKTKKHLHDTALLRKGLRAYYGGGGYANKVLFRSRYYQ